MIKSPCHKCEKRVLHCHSTCEDYFHFIKEYNLEKRKIKNEKSIDSYMFECITNGRKKGKR